jgi:hypothetical protein
MSDKRITIRPLPINVLSIAAFNALPQRRVATYARVSTDRQVRPDSSTRTDCYARCIITRGGKSV